MKIMILLIVCLLHLAYSDMRKSIHCCFSLFVCTHENNLVGYFKFLKILFFVAVFLGRFLVLCLLCVFLRPGAPERTAGSGSDFKASQKTRPRLKVSSNRLGEVGNRTCDPWFTRHMFIPSPRRISKVSKGAKIRNRYNRVPHLTQDTNGKVTISQ